LQALSVYEAFAAVLLTDIFSALHVTLICLIGALMPILILSLCDDSLSGLHSGLPLTRWCTCFASGARFEHDLVLIGAQLLKFERGLLLKAEQGLRLEQDFVVVVVVVVVLMLFLILLKVSFLMVYS